MALANTQIVRGTEHAGTQKLTSFFHVGALLFAIIGVVRSVQGKTLTYVKKTALETTFQSAVQVVHFFGEVPRQVCAEDGPSLPASGF